MKTGLDTPVIIASLNREGGMKNLALGAAAVGLLLLCVAIAQGQDAVKVAPAHYQVKVDNAQVRVIENTLAPGEKDPMHTHAGGWYYVTKPGTMKVVHADGQDHDMGSERRRRRLEWTPKGLTPRRTSERPPWGSCLRRGEKAPPNPEKRRKITSNVTGREVLLKGLPAFRLKI